MDMKFLPLGALVSATTITRVVAESPNILFIAIDDLNNTIIVLFSDHG